MTKLKVTIMIKTAYSLYDSSAKLYTSPFFCASEQQALRGVEAALNQENTNLSQYPQDFTLYEIGTYNESTGYIEALDIPQKIVNCQDHKVKCIREQYERQLDEQKLREFQADLFHTNEKAPDMS